MTKFWADTLHVCHNSDHCAQSLKLWESCFDWYIEYIMSAPIGLGGLFGNDDDSEAGDNDFAQQYEIANLTISGIDNIKIRQ